MIHAARLLVGLIALVLIAFLSMYAVTPVGAKAMGIGALAVLGLGFAYCLGGLLLHIFRNR